MPNSLYQSNEQYTLEQYDDYDQWLHGRTKGIGGSDAAAICGQSRWRTLQDLWFDKIEGKRSEAKGSAIDYGKAAEPALRILYAAKHTDQEVQYLPDSVLVQNDWPVRRYSPDGLIFEKDTDRRGILEIKTSQISNGHKAEKWREGVPIEYYLQVLHGLLVTGFDFVTFTAELRYWDGRVEIIERSFARDEVADDLMELDRIERETWSKYFDTKTIPPLTIRGDKNAI